MKKVIFLFLIIVYCSTISVAQSSEKQQLLLNWLNSSSFAITGSENKLQQWKIDTKQAVLLLLNTFSSSNAQTNKRSKKILQHFIAVTPDALPTLIEIAASEKKLSHQAAWFISGVEKAHPKALSWLVLYLKPQNKKIAIYAAQALRQLKTQSIPALIQGLAVNNTDIQLQTIKILRDLGPISQPAVPKLLTFLNNPSPKLVSWSIKTLGNIGFSSPEVILSLTQKSKLATPEIKIDIIVTLGLLQKISPEVKEILISGLRDKNKTICQRASWALTKIGKNAVVDLINILTDKKQSDLHSAVCIILGQIGQDASSASYVLSQLILSPDLTIRSNAIWAIGQTGIPSDKEIKILIKYLFENNRYIQQNTIISLANSPQRYYQLLQPLFKDTNVDIRAKAAVIIGHMGKRGAKFIPLLIKNLDDIEPKVRFFTAAALTKIGPGAALASSHLVSKLADKNPKVRTQCAKAIITIGQASVPHLTKALLSPNSEIRYQASLIVYNLGSIAKETLPALLQVIDDPNPRIRINCIKALGSMGTLAHVATPLLIKKLQRDPIPSVRLQAAIALSRIYPLAKESIIHAFKSVITQEQNPHIHLFVRQTLEKWRIK